jgi:hypothetical protein
MVDLFLTPRGLEKVVDSFEVFIFPSVDIVYMSFVHYLVVAWVQRQPLSLFVGLLVLPTILPQHGCKGRPRAYA